MFVFMLIASGLLVGWGAFLILTGDYIATLDIAATLVSAGVISLCLAFLTRTIASLPAQIAKNTAALTKNLAAPQASLPTPVQGSPVSQTDVSSITKAIAKATTPPQSAFGFPEVSASQPALPLMQDKDAQVKHPGFAERKLPPLPPRPAPIAPAPVAPAPSPAVAPPARVPAPALKNELPKASIPTPAPMPVAPPEVTPPEAAPAPLEAPAPVRLAQRPIIPPMAPVQPKEEKISPVEAPQPPAFEPEASLDLDAPEERIFLKEGSIDGTIYRFYSDGSAETDTPDGVQFFASIDEVRNSILLSRISLDMEEPSTDIPSSEAPAPSLASSDLTGWSTRPVAPAQEGSVSPFAFTPSRYTENIPETSGMNAEPRLDTPEQPNRSNSPNAANPELLDSDEWAEPFRMLLRKDKNPQG